MALTTLPLNIIECHSFISLQISASDITPGNVYAWFSVYDRGDKYTVCGLSLAPELLQSPPASFQPVYCESALSEAVFPINKQVEVQLLQLPTHRASQL